MSNSRAKGLNVHLLRNCLTRMLDPLYLKPGNVNKGLLKAEVQNDNDLNIN